MSCLKQCHAPQSPENEENKERAFTKSKKHKIDAVITLFLDRSQTVTQLTALHTHGVGGINPILTWSQLPAKMGPR